MAVDFFLGPAPQGQWIHVLGIVEPTCTRPPAITQPPQPLRVGRGEPATFSVVASSQGTTTYQWRQNQIPLADRPEVTGSTTPTLVFSSADASDAGTYNCVVTNPCGSATSATATLTVHGTACEGYWSVASAPPQGRREGIMAYHAGTQQMLAYGGFAGAGAGGTADNSLVRTGDFWQASAGCNSLSRRSLAAAAYDPARQRIVLFGGQWGGALMSPSVFEWDGMCFSDRGAPAGPTARYGHAMAYDPNSHSIILHGGLDASGVESGETWAWNGTAWTRLSVSGPAVTQHAMVTDTRRGRVVLFGGTSGGYLSEQTWEWNGHSWAASTAISRPSARVRAAMTFDEHLGRIVLFGGQDAFGPVADTWEYDGVDWIRVNAEGPLARAGAQMAYDSTQRRVVLMGGQDAANDPFHETWEWHHDPAGGSLTQPTNVLACGTSTAAFGVGPADSTSAYQWQWNRSGAWTNVVQGVNTSSTGVGFFVAGGAASNALSLDPAAGRWNALASGLVLRCIVTNSCGSITSNPATLTVCVADIDDGSSTGTCDGGITIDDLLYFLFVFELGDLSADTDDGSNTGTPDNGVTIDDLLYYLQRFEAGC